MLLCLLSSYAFLNSIFKMRTAELLCANGIAQPPFILSFRAFCLAVLAQTFLMFCEQFGKKMLMKILLLF